VEDITAVDDRTITIRWKEPYIDADTVFSVGTTLPLPRYKLKAQYLESKVDFPRLTLWLYDYVGTGPFRVRLRVDDDVLDWFKRQGPGYQTRINALLRAYMEEHLTRVGRG
jgi:ABC-type transport system substrate-binding protein